MLLVETIIDNYGYQSVSEGQRVLGDVLAAFAELKDEVLEKLSRNEQRGEVGDGENGPTSAQIRHNMERARRKLLEVNTLLGQNLQGSEGLEKVSEDLWDIYESYLCGQF